MKNLLFKVFLFLIPFLLYAAIVVMVDPYNIFNVSHLISDVDKIRVINRSNSSMPHGNLLWKTVEYERNPSRNIVLGDSRFTELNEDLISQLTDLDSIFNFSVPGGILPTSIDLFWLADRNIKLKTVFFQVGFTNYNEIVNYDLFTLRDKIKEKPLSIFTNLAVLKDTYVNILYFVTKNNKYVSETYWDGNPKHWDTEGLVRRFQNYKYPQKYYSELVKIKEYCEKSKIELVFLIAPNYMEFHDLVENNGVENEYERFVSDIKKLGVCMDSGKGTAFSKDKSNYIDFVHYEDRMVDSATAIMWKEYKTY